MKLAILFAMLPREVHERMLDRCSMQWNSLKEEDVAKAVRSSTLEAKELAKSRREQGVPIPMDISEIGQGPAEPGVEARGGNYDWREDEWATEEEWKEYEVDTIGKGFAKGSKGKGKGKSCFLCGEVGHMQY